MNKKGPILVIEDDADDQYLMVTALREAGCLNRVVCFSHGEEALAYLKGDDVQPFLIFCDINLPKFSGFEIKQAVQSDPEPRKKGVPFIYFTTSVNGRDVSAAFRLSVQGFFVKPNSYDRLLEIVTAITTYWQMCCAKND